MTTAITPTDLASSIVSELGGSESNVDMMIGIGLNKESDAVYFQYLGEEQKPAALMMPSGKPCTRMANIRLVGLDVAEDVGEFKSTKLNLFIDGTHFKPLCLCLFFCNILVVVLFVWMIFKSLCSEPCFFGLNCFFKFGFRCCSIKGRIKDLIQV